MKIVTNIIGILFLSAFLLNTTSCSVVMAANKDGVDISKIQACRTRGQILSTGASPISNETLENGDIIESYQIQKPRGSASRALMHGALDVCTFGVWEVVGTPIEAYADQKEYYALRITYDRNETIQKVEIL
jgi:hypothetical protein